LKRLLKQKEPLLQLHNVTIVAKPVIILLRKTNIFLLRGLQICVRSIEKNGLCDYYELSNTPGIKLKGKFSSDKFAYLDNEKIQQKLIQFTDGQQS